MESSPDTGPRDPPIDLPTDDETVATAGGEKLTADDDEATEEVDGDEDEEPDVDETDTGTDDVPE